ncbi:Thiol-disulfide isomerase or thioredoxin [Thiothrix caldifontis]|uniref:Thiol-disulfide isomerase or thioredoxin n=1 Tax=Thiothrix caldifontis TaxID=525918 RepID=A0A1H4GE95_9GAMM|nr:TlpA disulfide reductase family protein [Thiothrix caldifontis]SEB07929.1 Thiol-disulfide isomerase or thioredoxin [Thiothrix caldifontis]
MLVIGNKLKYTVVLGGALLIGCSEPIVTPLTLPLLSGEKAHIPDMNGKLTWVNVWSTSCTICVKELPALEALQREYAERVQVVAVALPTDPPNTVLDVQTTLQLTLPVALDLDGQAARQFAPDLVVPSHHLVDAKGNILYQTKGKLTLAEMRTMLEKPISASFIQR